jgi:hypothetical protein
MRLGGVGGWLRDAVGRASKQTCVVGRGSWSRSERNTNGTVAAAAVWIRRSQVT